MKTRIFLLASLCFITFASRRGPLPLAHAQSSGDLHLLRTASQSLAQHTRPQVLRWLHKQPGVRAAAIGADGRTINLTFRDGMQGDILASQLKPVKVAFRGEARMAAPAQQSAAPSALVAEPFATELGLGGNAGDVEVHDLQVAGFRVDQLYNTQVTVASMLSLANYNVVYMHTHSGVLPNGHGVVATGELANGDPAVSPYLADGTVVVVGVAGSTDMYYAITSGFIAAHAGQFRHDSLLFINGCSLLSTPDFGQALLARGAGVLVSWDQLGTSQDDFLSAAAFFNVMSQGKTVSDAIASLRAAGYGISHYQGATATLGLQGDGAITLTAAAQGPLPTAPSATPTSTATPTPTPTAITVPPTASATTVPTPTATPTSTPSVKLPPPPPSNPPTPTPATATPTSTALPTATATPHTVLQGTLKPVVAPESMQHVLAHYAANTPLHFRVVFPNGDVRQTQKSTDASGSAIFVFKQHASKISRESSRATVQISTLDGAGVPVTLRYRIAWGPIDLAVEPRVQRPGHTVVIWVHSRASTAIAVTIQVHGQKTAHLDAITARDGWAELVRKIGIHARPRATVYVRADVRLNHKDRHTSATYQVS